MELILSFLGAAALIIIAGKSLAGLADDLAEATGISKGFIGFLLLSSVTSLPEVVTSVSATLYVNAAGMAFGNVFGSNMVNLVFVFLMDIFYKEFEDRGRVLSQMKGQEIPMALWVVILTSLSLLGVVLGLNESTRVRIAHISPVTIPLLVLYALSIRSVYSAEKKIEGTGEAIGENRAEEPPSLPPAVSIARLVLKFILAACIIGAGGMWLTSTCDRIATVTGMGKTFVGVVLLALVTSLPEMSVTLAAVRQGNLGMGLANLLGSNIFNLTILGICDLVSFGKSPFLDPGAVQSLPGALTSLMMVAVLIFGIYDPKWRRAWCGVTLASWILLILYLGGTVLTYITG